MRTDPRVTHKEPRHLSVLIVNSDIPLLMPATTTQVGSIGVAEKKIWPDTNAIKYHQLTK